MAHPKSKPGKRHHKKWSPEKRKAYNRAHRRLIDAFNSGEHGTITISLS